MLVSWWFHVGFMVVGSWSGIGFMLVSLWFHVVGTWDSFHVVVSCCVQCDFLHAIPRYCGLGNWTNHWYLAQYINWVASTLRGTSVWPHGLN